LGKAAYFDFAIDCVPNGIICKSRISDSEFIVDLLPLHEYADEVAGLSGGKKIFQGPDREWSRSMGNALQNKQAFYPLTDKKPGGITTVC
jgi:hypothetical protein